MLRMNVIRSATDAKRYYTQNLKRDDYYSEGQEIAGHWHGKGAALLGLRDQVDEESFFALADNIHPTRGGTLTVRQREDARVGLDITMSAPKSVSLLYARTGDEKILEAVRVSVNDTMREMESEMKTRVRKGGAWSERQTSNAVWCDFIHLTTRPVDGIPDLDMHAHCVLFNRTYDPVEKRWKAAEWHDLKRDAPYYESAFQARLAANMRALGFRIERHGKWWDVAGIPRSLIEKFSRRSAIIEAKAEEEGITDAKAKDKLGAKTREKKALHLNHETLKEAWWGRLSAEDRKTLEDVISGATEESGGQSGKISPEETIRYAIADCFERASVTSEKRLLETALRRGYGEVTPEQVKDAAARAGILTRVIDGRTLVTTREVLAEEQQMLAFARDGRGTCRPLNPEGRVYHSDTLNQDQINAVRHVVTSPDRVTMIRGAAGTGKTTLTREAARLIEAGGQDVFFFAPSADASRGVLRQEGFSEADTVARLLVEEVLQKRVSGNVLWIDEAGLLGVRDMAKVFTLAEQLGCRVILSGDPKQHASVARGDAMRLLEEKGGIRPAKVKEIVRQRGSYKDAVAALEKSDTEGGFQQLDNLGWVVEVPDELRHALLVKDYLAALDAGESALVIAPTHREGETVSEHIREALEERGKIDQHERPFWTLRNLHWTEAQKSDAHLYRPGLVVQFFQNAKGIKNGERFRIEGEDANGVRLIDQDGRQTTLPLHQAARFQVYEPLPLGLAAGDTIRITQNYRSAQDSYRLDNGTLCQVKAITGKGEIVLANGRKLPEDFAHFTHGYVTTSHSSQGKTVDRVLIAQGAESFAASSREQFYVSVSRGKKQARIYTDDKETLREHIKKSGERASATELLEGDVTAQARPRRIEEWLRERAARIRRYRHQREKVIAAKTPRLVKDRDQEETAGKERSGYGAAMER